MTMGDRRARRLLRNLLADGPDTIRGDDIQAINFQVRRAMEDLERVAESLAAVERRGQELSPQALQEVSRARAELAAIRNGLNTLSQRIERAGQIQGIAPPAPPTTVEGPPPGQLPLIEGRQQPPSVLE